MSEETPNRQRLRLATADYEKLRRKILDRDGWRCQHCGRRDQLQIHHMIRRSQLGDDSEGNLITLCSDCHTAVHAH
jgi:5-methylcytosine-specific restriction protein A